MGVRSFFDSNILVHTDDHDAPKKQTAALNLVEEARLQRSGVISTQVLQEYFAAAIRKLKVGPEIARRKVEIFARLDVVQVDLDLILGAIDPRNRYAFAIGRYVSQGSRRPSHRRDRPAPPRPACHR